MYEQNLKKGNSFQNFETAKKWKQEDFLNHAAQSNQLFFGEIPIKSGLGDLVDAPLSCLQR